MVQRMSQAAIDACLEDSHRQVRSALARAQAEIAKRSILPKSNGIGTGFDVPLAKSR